MAQPQPDRPSSALQPDPLVGDCVNPEQIRFWIQDCEENHGARCNSADHKSETAVTELRLIDVVDLCIVSTTSEIRYFALSYVWGGVEQLQLTVENCLELSRPGSLQQCWNKIPTTIQDAIHCAAALQEKYLWVDSLCIVQNDSTIKHNEISRMGSIYDGAVACLAAVAGVDANSGLAGVRAQTRTPGLRKLQYENVYLIHPGPHEYTSLRRPRDNSPYITLERRLKPRQLDLRDRLMNSLYDSRAWAYQERLLSRKCIYFMDNMVYFHCRSVIRAENKTTPYTQRTQDIRQLSLFKTDPIFSGDPFRYSRTLGAIYAGLVTEYTLKHLTFPGDILKAFSGIGASMEKLCGWRFVAGMPEIILEYALLWGQNVGPHQRRSKSSGDVFPSWSWAGWTTAVRYDTICRTEPEYEPFLADMESLICELHIYDGKTARLIQNSVATNLQLSIERNKPPPTDVPQWLDRFNNMQISRNVLIFRARIWPLFPFRQLLTLRALANTQLEDSTAYSEFERLSGIQFPDLTLEVVFLSLIKEAGYENESWNGSSCSINFMVIQWNGDFAERKFVGKMSAVLVKNITVHGPGMSAVPVDNMRVHSPGMSFLFRLEHDLFGADDCHWKTIRLI
ncbi:HET-domain-containing protein [Stipitochalara longipes BDJ]|nr:HET-domain-containing protein [Stipitochalara longipes BDJ]